MPLGKSDDGLNNVFFGNHGENIYIGRIPT